MSVLRILAYHVIKRMLQQPQIRIIRMLDLTIIVRLVMVLPIGNRPIGTTLRLDLYWLERMPRCSVFLVIRKRISARARLAMDVTPATSQR